MIIYQNKGITMKNNLFVLVGTMLLISCININNRINKGVENNRYFQFIYEVEIEPTDGKKIELWIPIPQSNEAQTISELIYNFSGLSYQLKTEPIHNNQYLYIYSNDGVTDTTNIRISFNVLRKEHNNINYKNVNPSNYLRSYAHVPIGGIFSNIIKENNLSRHNIKGVYDFVLNGMHYAKPKNSSSDDIYYSSKNPNTNEDWLPDEGKFGRFAVTKDEVVNIYKESKKMNTKYTFGNGNSLYACDIGVGNCTDFHSYFMSIGRTLEIPIRFHMGFSIPAQ